MDPFVVVAKNKSVVNVGGYFSKNSIKARRCNAVFQLFSEYFHCGIQMFLHRRSRSLIFPGTGYIEPVAFRR